MRSAIKSLFSALAAALLLGAAAPLTAQAAMLGAGGGMVQQGPVVRGYGFYCLQLPGGAATGQVVSWEPTSQSHLTMRISSAMHIGPWLAVAGQVTHAVNTPPQLSVGATMFLVFADNGRSGAVPDQLASGVVPSFLGNLTIQQIVALIGPPPAAAFGPFLSGGIKLL